MHSSVYHKCLTSGRTSVSEFWKTIFILRVEVNR